MGGFPSPRVAGHCPSPLGGPAAGRRGKVTPVLVKKGMNSTGGRKGETNALNDSISPHLLAPHLYRVNLRKPLK
ncbi:hypothetical protein VTK73DRAFT_5673 [Phialemonium thermophilum]|uniref:Uncharacterized protein n=1 Tax=Phialemonium thermophilum TaxID=223376 RepID=A0ABR3WMM1_9PEZI